MKRIFLSAALCMLVSVTFAQKKAVKDARASLDDSKFSEALEYLKPALTDPETATDPATWKLEGDINNKVIEGEYLKQIKGETGNEDLQYNSTLATYIPYFRADSLGQIPNAKGKIKNKYRKDIAALMKANHQYFRNGGIYFFNNKKDYAKASECFEDYWNIPSWPCFADLEEKDKINTNDSIFQQIKFYAVLSAMNSKNEAHALDLLNRIKQEPFTPNSVYTEEKVYEMIAGQYQTMKDSVNYNKALTEGIAKYPKNQFFLTNLINVYITRGQSKEAIDYLNKAIETDPKNAGEYYAAEGQLYAKLENYSEAETTFKKALSIDPKSQKALESLGIVYLIQGQKLSNKSEELKSNKAQADMVSQANDFYKKAAPYFEQYKEVLKEKNAEKKDVVGVLMKLRFIYNQLKMNTEYEAADKELTALTAK